MPNLVKKGFSGLVVAVAIIFAGLAIGIDEAKEAIDEYLKA